MADELRLMGYRRISDTGQGDCCDLPGQETNLRAYSHSTGHCLVRIETDGAEPRSLSPAERPGLLRPAHPRLRR
jgi:hypothetical protein